MDERHREHFQCLGFAHPALIPAMQDIANAGDVTLKRIESERAVAGDRGLHAQCQAAIKSVALEHFGVLVEPPVEAVQRMPELGRIMLAERLRFAGRKLGRLRQVEPTMQPIRSEEHKSELQSLM